LVAHRGYARHYPENTIEGITAALEAGANYIEFDVHLNVEEIPVVIHDMQLFRTTGSFGLVCETPLDELFKLDANEPNRFQKARLHSIRIPTLERLVSLLEAWPDAIPLVELKRASLKQFGRTLMVKRVLEVLQPIIDRSIIISFDAESLDVSRQQGAKKIGWVIETWNEPSHQTAKKLAPEYLICNHTKLPEPPQPLWQGPWQWAAYDTADVDLALQLAERDVALVETMAIGEMLADPRLKPPG
jgi:glycerophosphoryl diester phosphodiesterase